MIALYRKNRKRFDLWPEEDRKDLAKYDSHVASFILTVGRSVTDQDDLTFLAFDDALQWLRYYLSDEHGKINIFEHLADWLNIRDHSLTLSGMLYTKFRVEIEEALSAENKSPRGENSTKNVKPMAVFVSKMDDCQLDPRFKRKKFLSDIDYCRRGCEILTLRKLFHEVIVSRLLALARQTFAERYDKCLQQQRAREANLPQGSFTRYEPWKSDDEYSKGAS